MNKGEAWPFRLDCFSFASQLSDRFAAKRSTKVPQEDEQNGRFSQECGERLSSWREVRIKQRFVNRFGMGHATTPGSQRPILSEYRAVRNLRAAGRVRHWNGAYGLFFPGASTAVQLDSVVTLLSEAV
jgi:hypothetical protein